MSWTSISQKNILVSLFITSHYKLHKVTLKVTAPFIHNHNILSKTYYSIRCQITHYIVKLFVIIRQISFSQIIRNYIVIVQSFSSSTNRTLTSIDCISDMSLQSGRCTLYKCVMCAAKKYCIHWFTDSWVLLGIQQRWTATLA